MVYANLVIQSAYAVPPGLAVLLLLFCSKWPDVKSVNKTHSTIHIMNDWLRILSLCTHTQYD